MGLLRRRNQRSDTWRLLVSAATDQGLARTENQDAVLGRTGVVDLEPREVALVAVADGMGGGPEGALASREALVRLSAAFGEAPGEPPERLRRALAEANRHVHAFVERDPSYAGMGTTVVAAALGAGRAWVANVGDSRAYVIRGGRMRQVTEDHSWVQEQVRAGIMSPAEAARSPYRNVITRAVGTDRAVPADVFGPLDLEEGDTLLLCSDGLHGVLDEGRMLEAAGSVPFPEAADALVAAANAAGGPDNIAVVLVRAAGPAP